MSFDILKVINYSQLSFYNFNLFSREALKIPIFANGNILCYQDVLECLNQTGCDGVMSAGFSFFEIILCNKSSVIINNVRMQFIQSGTIRKFESVVVGHST